MVVGILAGEGPGGQQHQTDEKGQAEGGQTVLPDEG